MSKILDQYRKRIDYCEICRNTRHINERRCECWQDMQFVELFLDAGVQEDCIDFAKAQEIRELILKQPIVVVEELNINKREKWTHSAAYIMTKYGCCTKIASDKDVHSTLFDDQDDLKSVESINEFIRPAFLILEIATIKNKTYISQYILNILKTRKRKYKSTLVIVKKLDAIKSKYQDDDLYDYVFPLVKD